MNDDDYKMTPALRPAAEELVRDNFNPRMRGFIDLEGKEGVTDYLAHIDIICSSSKALRYKNIDEKVVLETQTIGIDWKRASYENWATGRRWLTVPFSDSLIQSGQNTVLLHLFEDESGKEIVGWIALLWNRELATHLTINWPKYRSVNKIGKSTRDGKEFWYLELEYLLADFRYFVLGYDITKFPAICLPLKHEITSFQ